MYKKVCYISGPLRAKGAPLGLFTPHQLQQNIRIAEHWAKIAWVAGWATICPHLNTLNMDGIAGVTSEAFIAGDKTMLDRMAAGLDCIMMIPGWEHSDGAMEEHEHAKARGLLVVYTSAMNHNPVLMDQYMRLLYSSVEEAASYLESVA